MTTDDITHCVYGRSRRSTTSCSLRFCFLRTGQTAVASIPRLSLSGLREMRSRLRLFCLLSRATYLLDDLPVSSLRMPVTRLGSSGFSPEVVRSLSTCSNRVHSARFSWTILLHLPLKRKGDTEREITTGVNISKELVPTHQSIPKDISFGILHMLFNQQRNDIANLVAAFISSQTPRFAFTVPLHIRQKEAGSQSHTAN